MANRRRPPRASIALAAIALACWAPGAGCAPVGGPAVLRDLVVDGGGPVGRAANASEGVNASHVMPRTTDAHATALRDLVLENQWKNELVLCLLPASVRERLPRPAQVGCWARRRRRPPTARHRTLLHARPRRRGSAAG